VTELAYRVVDVFTDRPFTGNGLCVVTEPCPEPLMQSVAREANLSETTFVTSVGEGAYSMRIFTPSSELPFAGHPSLGTAWVLGPGTWEQTTPGAVVRVDVDEGGAEMSQPDPELTEVSPEGVAAALGVPGVEGAFLSVAGGTAHVLVPTTAPLDSIAPDLASVARVSVALGGMSLAPFRRLSDSELHARVFVPAGGIAEDPGTGSAAGPIACHLCRHELVEWGEWIEITQGVEIRRPSTLFARAQGAGGQIVGVECGGRAVVVARGEFRL
jgi:trans-2,3-dihydro-3-hydroxyanthranilate isomerase